MSVIFFPSPFINVEHSLLSSERRPIQSAPVRGDENKKSFVFFQRHRHSHISRTLRTAQNTTTYEAVHNLLRIGTNTAAAAAESSNVLAGGVHRRSMRRRRRRRYTNGSPRTLYSYDIFIYYFLFPTTGFTFISFFRS